MLVGKEQPDTNALNTLNVDEAWRSVEALLNERLSAVQEEVRHYPAPIPACDAQFNYLLEQRSHLPQEIARAKALAKRSIPQAEARKLREDFVAACPYLDKVETGEASDAEP